MVPPGTWIAGASCSRAAAISCPGSPLSQLDSSTIASMGCVFQWTSIMLQTISRDNKE
jgi:hypothetical protein